MSLNTLTLNVPTLTPENLATEAAILKPFEDDTEAVLVRVESESISIDVTNKRHRALFVSQFVDLINGHYAAPESGNKELLALQRVVGRAEEVIQYDDGAQGITQHLPKAVELLEGDAVALAELLRIFRSLCISVDFKVVIEASRGLNELIASNVDAELFRTICHMLTEFAGSVYAAPRCCAALTLHSLYEFLEERDRDLLLAAFKRLCRDTDLLVRRAAIMALVDWADALQADAGKHLLPLLAEFSKEEDHDSVRVQLLLAIADLSQKGFPTATKSEMCRIVILLSQDESWRVRFIAAQHMATLTTAFSATSLTPSIVLLAQDEEREVRAVIAAQLGTICEGAVPTKLLAAYLDIVVSLAEDESITVRTAVAGVLCAVFAQCTAVPESERLMALIFKFLDESDAVKIQIIENLWKLGPAVLSDSAQAERLASVLTKAVSGNQWRLREAAAGALKPLAPYVNAAIYQAFLKQSISKLLVDPVQAVRQAMIASLAALSRQLGERWSLKTLVEIQTHATLPTYRERQAYTAALEVMLPFLENKPSDDLSVIEKSIIALAADPVVNVRIMVARALCNAVVPSTLAGLRTKVVAALQQDVDEDVRKAATPPVAKAPF